MLILYFFFIAYFLVVGRFAVKFMRYLLPLYGLLSLFSAWFIFLLIKSRKKKFSTVGKAMLIVVAASCFLWSMAFSSIYSQASTRVQATRWINKQIPPGAKIAVEHWDDRVPMKGDYKFLEMPMYEPDDSELKWRKVSNNLAEADLLVLASNRLYTPLQKLGDCKKYPKRCYPKTSKYYHDLFSGRLGFEKVAEFTNFPTLEFAGFKWEIDDSAADESFTVYDHPKVLLFSKLK